MAKYRVKGIDSKIVHDGVLYAFGDEIDLPKSVAIELRHQLDPLEPVAMFEPDSAFVPPSLPAHEREFLLTERKRELLKQVALIDEELAQPIEPAVSPSAPKPDEQ